MRRIAAIIALASAQLAHAQFLDGNELLDRLNNTGAVRPMVGLGYVMGALDAHYGVEICPPEAVQIGQASDVVKQWLQNNPDKRHYPAALIIRAVLRNTWPCKPQTKLDSGGKL